MRLLHGEMGGDDSHDRMKEAPVHSGNPPCAYLAGHSGSGLGQREHRLGVDEVDGSVEDMAGGIGGEGVKN